MSISRLLNLIRNPKRIFVSLGARGLFPMDDEAYLKAQFERVMGYPLNLDNPQTFNEKLQWLKLHDRKPEYTMMVDKYAVKQYVAEKIGLY